MVQVAQYSKFLAEEFWQSLNKETMSEISDKRWVSSLFPDMGTVCYHKTIWVMIIKTQLHYDYQNHKGLQNENSKHTWAV